MNTRIRQTRRLRAARFFAALLIAQVCIAHAAESSHEPLPLRVGVAQAVATVVAKASAVETLDEGKLRVYRLDVLRTIAGDAGAKKVAAIELTNPAAPAPPFIDVGTRAVVLLGKAPSYSYLRKHVKTDRYYVVVNDRHGAIQAKDNAELGVLESALQNAAAIGPADTAANRAARLELALQELQSGNARLAADAVAEIGRLGSLKDLDTAQAKTIGGAIVDESVQSEVRARLIAACAGAGAVPLLGELQRVGADDPVVLRAALEARAVLGKPAQRPELGRYLGSNDDRVRAAAVRALGFLTHKDTLAHLGRFATDDTSSEVRLAAIDALGASGEEDALPHLAKSFEFEERPVKQASARAILAIGGDAADETLVRLATGGKSTETKVYATALLLTRHARDHPLIKKVEESDPGPHVRELIEHGLRSGGTHTHH